MRTLTILMATALALPLLAACNGEVGVGGQCRFRTGFNSGAYDVRRCVDGAYCASDNHCHAFSQLGERCDQDVYVCDAHLACGGFECTVGGVCSGSCLAYVEAGSACVDDTQCLDSRCIRDAAGDGICAADGGEGAACNAYLLDRHDPLPAEVGCAEGFTCQPSSEQAPSWCAFDLRTCPLPGTCIAEASLDEGDACVRGEACPGGSMCWRPLPAFRYDSLYQPPGDLIAVSPPGFGVCYGGDGPIETLGCDFECDGCEETGCAPGLACMSDCFDSDSCTGGWVQICRTEHSLRRGEPCGLVVGPDGPDYQSDPNDYCAHGLSCERGQCVE